MRFCLQTVCMALALSGLVGCGGDPPDPSKPLAGGAPRASQLVGSWVALTEGGDFVGIDFMKDGKALLSQGPDGGVTTEYTLFEDGRLSFSVVAATGLSMVYSATIAGDQLELKSAKSLISAGGSQRLRRLKSGETLVSALAANREAKARAYQERVAQLGEFLKRPGLVLAVNPPGPGAPPAIALDLGQAGGQAFQGKAWHDDRPPHLDAISGQLSLNQAAATAQVMVQFGQRISPLAAQPSSGGGQITLNVTGTGKDLAIAGKVTYGQGKDFDLELRADPKLHDEVVTRYDAEIARIESLKAPIASLLKDHAVLLGRLDPMDQRQTSPDTADLVLLRDPKNGLYGCLGVTFSGGRGRGELVSSGAAGIVVENDRPKLRIVCPPAREYLLGVTGAGAEKLAGQWGPPGYAQKSARFEVVEALDAAARDAKFEAQRKSLRELGADSVLLGLAFEDSGFGLEMPIPLRLKLTVNPDGGVTGKAHYPSMMTLLSVTGKVAETPIGPRLELSYTADDETPGDKVFFRSIQAGTWRLSRAEGGGTMKLAGYFTGPPVRTAAFVVQSDAARAELRKGLAQAMGSGGRFHLARYVGWQTPGQPPTVLELKLDEASSKVTGRVLTGGRPLGANDKASTYEGDLKDEDGWALLDLQQKTAFGNSTLLSALKLLAIEDQGGVLHLSGAAAGLGRAGGPIPNPPKYDQWLDLIPVGATDAATHAEIDKAIAATEKAKADAVAQVEAQEKAVADAQRVKFMPFVPAFQSKGGAVITTDAGPEMGAVILEAFVDESKSTIAGRGIDLREMPLREFTFQAAVDARGQLALTTSIAKDPYLFQAPNDKGLAGRGVALATLSEADRSRLDALIELGKRLGSAPPMNLTVETLNAKDAKAREVGLPASSLPGVAIFQKRKNDPVAAMFTVQANGAYRWAKEPISLRLKEPAKGKAIYLKGGGATQDLTVVINGVHRATIAAIERLGAAIINLPPDLEVLDLRLEAGGMAQARGVVMLK